MMALAKNNSQTIAISLAAFSLYQNRETVYNILNQLWTFGGSVWNWAEREVQLVRVSYFPIHQYQLDAERIHKGLQPKLEGRDGHWLLSFKKEYKKFLRSVDTYEEQLPFLQGVEKLTELHIMPDRCDTDSGIEARFSQGYFIKFIKAILDKTPFSELSQDQFVVITRAWHFLVSIDAIISIDDLKKDSMVKLIGYQRDLDENDNSFCQALETGLIRKSKKCSGFIVNESNIEKTWKVFQGMFRIAPNCKDSLYSELIENCTLWLSIDQEAFFLLKLRDLNFVDLTLFSFQQTPLCVFSRKIHRVYEQVVEFEEERKYLIKRLTKKLLEANVLQNGDAVLNDFYTKSNEELKAKDLGLELLTTMHKDHTTFPFGVAARIKPVLKQLESGGALRFIVKMVEVHLCKTLLHGFLVDQEKIEETVAQAQQFGFYLKRTGRSYRDQVKSCQVYFDKDHSLFSIAIYHEQVEAKGMDSEISLRHCFSRHVELVCLKPDPYTQVNIHNLNALLLTCLAIVYSPSKSFAIQALYLICAL
jgi:hypothetical protein